MNVKNKYITNIIICILTCSLQVLLSLFYSVYHWEILGWITAKKRETGRSIAFSGRYPQVTVWKIYAAKEKEPHWWRTRRESDSNGGETRVNWWTSFNGDRTGSTSKSVPSLVDASPHHQDLSGFKATIPSTRSVKTETAYLLIQFDVCSVFRSGFQRPTGIFWVVLFPRTVARLLAAAMLLTLYLWQWHQQEYHRETSFRGGKVEQCNS